jgi:hypothetical protein
MKLPNSGWVLRVDEGAQAPGLDVAEYGEVSYRRDFWEP